MSNELKPCPFCGSKDIRIDRHVRAGRGEHHGADVFSMGCFDCGATFPNRYKREILVENWNQRVAQSSHLHGHAPGITMDEVIEHVAMRYGYTAEQIKGRDRLMRVSFARHVAMTLCREITGEILTGISLHFDGRNHATVSYAINAVRDERRTNPQADAFIAKIKSETLELYGEEAA